MSLNFDPEDWITTEYHNGTHYLHCDSGIKVTELNGKYSVQLDYIVIYRCEVLSQEDIDFCLHYTRTIRDNVVVTKRLMLHCKLCKKDFVGEIYWHFRANHDSYTKSASKT